MHWGKFIFVLYMSFVGLIGLLVYGAVSTSFDLVSPDYYAKEIAFQSQINATDQAQALSVPVEFSVQNNQMQLIFPAELQGKALTGNVQIYCPWNAKNDKTLPFSATTEKEINIAIPNLPKGAYKAIIDWKAEDKSYHIEKAMTL